MRGLSPKRQDLVTDRSGMGSPGAGSPEPRSTDPCPRPCVFSCLRRRQVSRAQQLLALVPGAPGTAWSPCPAAPTPPRPCLHGRLFLRWCTCPAQCACAHGGRTYQVSRGLGLAPESGTGHPAGSQNPWCMLHRSIQDVTLEIDNTLAPLSFLELLIYCY